ncbi:NFACT RNA binding domain-containing protein [Pontibacter sp. HSC-36F09]|uniref:NFACT RNA binding domain-containing protein n=1 Tax=Pontibacter sp. HSC-36F09 TaxID=2910966 RepID=UPI0020A07E2C|nr:NFACT RNA binding domain-containing protein [Pontibacter sp. HSC-36F09]MCP2043875.1 putative ribosome quality control (RQC) complex YloA/Tae2 family protein [Pontibacter sp. HSC-36F09]
MHQNYYFLRQLSEQLRSQLVGMEVITCFSQNKDELVIGFAAGEQELYIRAALTSHFSSLSFPTEFKRARANTINLFGELLEKTVQDVVQHLNERSFYLKLSKGYILLFKLFGNRSNIVLFRGDEPLKPFHKKFGADLELNPLQMNRPIRQNFEAFVAVDGNLKKVYPTFGDLPALYLEQLGYSNASLEEKWELVQAMLEQLEAPEAYYVIRLNGKLRLSLLQLGEVLQVYDNPIEALNGFTRSYLSETGFEQLFEQTQQQLLKKQRATQAILEQTEARLHELRHGRSYSQIADIIMANLTNIPPRATEVELYDFYTDRQRKFKLKATETPQKQAERLYRKAKKQHVEINQLEERQERKLEEAIVLEDALQALDEAKTYKALKLYLKEYAHLLTTKQQAQQEAPFRLFETEGFKILVGKSAQNNDLLTQRHTYKEDIWLHAKDVSGSHVVIKYQAGKAIPATVLEKAAQLAAYYSKRKSDSLCPVLYTPKKWVRKPKGAPAGAVVVEREQVMLVKPENPFERKV